MFHWYEKKSKGSEFNNKTALTQPQARGSGNDGLLIT